MVSTPAQRNLYPSIRNECAPHGNVEYWQAVNDWIYANTTNTVTSDARDVEIACLRSTLASAKATIAELQQALRDVSTSYLDELREMAREAQR